MIRQRVDRSLNRDRVVDAVIWDRAEASNAYRIIIGRTGGRPDIARKRRQVDGEGSKRLGANGSVLIVANLTFNARQRVRAVVG